MFLIIKYLLDGGYQLDDVVMFFPADHYIYPVDKFRQYINELVDCTKNNNLLGLVGIKPSFPHTGYGYIRLSEKINGNIYLVDSFKEKPNYELAQQYIES
jgi:mannose-1-phosphate guanylyltransferase